MFSFRTISRIIVKLKCKNERRGFIRVTKTAD